MQVKKKQLHHHLWKSYCSQWEAAVQLSLSLPLWSLWSYNIGPNRKKKLPDSIKGVSGVLPSGYSYYSKLDGNTTHLAFLPWYSVRAVTIVSSLHTVDFVEFLSCCSKTDAAQHPKLRKWQLNCELNTVSLLPTLQMLKGKSSSATLKGRVVSHGDSTTQHVKCNGFLDELSEAWENNLKSCHLNPIHENWKPNLRPWALRGKAFYRVWTFPDSDSNLMVVWYYKAVAIPPLSQRCWFNLGIVLSCPAFRRLDCMTICLPSETFLCC